MTSLKRDITSCLVLCAVAVGIALAWGSPFVGPRAAYANDPQLQGRQEQEQNQPAVGTKSKPHPGIPERAHSR
jgi:hypothetical protein